MTIRHIPAVSKEPTVQDQLKAVLISVQNMQKSLDIVVKDSEDSQPPALLDTHRISTVLERQSKNLSAFNEKFLSLPPVEKLSADNVMEIVNSLDSLKRKVVQLVDGYYLTEFWAREESHKDNHLATAALALYVESATFIYTALKISFTGNQGVEHDVALLERAYEMTEFQNIQKISQIIKALSLDASHGRTYQDAFRDLNYGLIEVNKRINDCTGAFWREYLNIELLKRKKEIKEEITPHLLDNKYIDAWMSFEELRKADVGGLRMPNGDIQRVPNHSGYMQNTVLDELVKPPKEAIDKRKGEKEKGKSKRVTVNVVRRVLFSPRTDKKKVRLYDDKDGGGAISPTEVTGEVSKASREEVEQKVSSWISEHKKTDQDKDHVARSLIGKMKREGDWAASFDEMKPLVKHLLDVMEYVGLSVEVETQIVTGAKEGGSVAEATKKVVKYNGKTDENFVVVDILRAVCEPIKNRLSGKEGFESKKYSSPEDMQEHVLKLVEQYLGNFCFKYSGLKDEVLRNLGHDTVVEQSPIYGEILGSYAQVHAKEGLVDLLSESYFTEYAEARTLVSTVCSISDAGGCVVDAGRHFGPVCSTNNRGPMI